MTFDPKAFIEAHEWRFAKTMPQNPHWYVVREKVADDEAFDAMVRFIRQEGEVRRWGGKLYQYWFSDDGFYYWTMGWPVDETLIINRAEHGACQAKPVKDGSVYVAGWSSKDGKRPPL